MSTLIVALLLLPIAVVLLGGLVLLLARPLVTPVITAFEGARFQRCRAHVARGDLQLQGRQIEAALREFEAAFCFMTVRADPRLAEQIGRHHVGLLSRLLSVADDLPQQRVRLLALAKTDRLLARRGEMQRAYLQLRNRPLRDGRRLQLERELRRNARDLRAAVRELIADLQVISSRTVAYQ
ncbi:MAG TPA: hypothetical protein VE911_00545 [Candidatus Nitrosopolaris sp.]|nr:hypothetical protein [Candidatus Nitrosopolaris sp.]